MCGVEPGVFGEPYESSRPEFETIETIKMGELASVEPSSHSA